MKQRGSEAGFTMVELLVVLVVSSFVVAAAWSLAQIGGEVHVRELRRADSERTRRNLEVGVGAALERSTRAGFSSHNFGMARVGVATSSGVEGDTLILIRAAGRALGVASRPCAAGASALCIALQGDQGSTVKEAQLLAVGSDKAGYRLVQVRSVGGPYDVPCGADCPQEAFCPVTIHPASVVSDVVLATTTAGGGGGSVSVSGPCRESFEPGRSCQETRVNRNTAPALLSQCTSVTGLHARFTNIQGDDRTAVAGFPMPVEWSAVSGGSAPAIAAVPVEIARYYTVPEAGERALHVRQGLTATGSWTAARRLAGPIGGFRVEALHQGQPAWTRGDGVDDATLAAASNRIVETVPGPDKVGIRYFRGYHTLVGLRVRAEAISKNGEGARALHPIWIVQSLAPLARGGARETP